MVLLAATHGGVWGVGCSKAVNVSVCRQHARCTQSWRVCLRRWAGCSHTHTHLPALGLLEQPALAHFGFFPQAAFLAHLLPRSQTRKKVEKKEKRKEKEKEKKEKKKKKKKKGSNRRKAARMTKNAVMTSDLGRLCLSVCLPVCLSVYPSISVSMYRCINVSVHVCMYVYVCIRASLHPSIHTPIRK